MQKNSGSEIVRITLIVEPRVLPEQTEGFSCFLLSDTSRSSLDWWGARLIIFLESSKSTMGSLRPRLQMRHLEVEGSKPSRGTTWG